MDNHPSILQHIQNNQVMNIHNRSWKNRKKYNLTKTRENKQKENKHAKLEFYTAVILLY